MTYVADHNYGLGLPPSKERSRNMGQVRSKNTSPELIVRKVCHRLGFRYRLHAKGLPGTPDLVFAGRRKVIFVHGCFWHRHAGCKRASMPTTRKEFWEAKFARNIARDEDALRSLKGKGWQVLVLWECELKDLAALEETLSRYLNKAVEPHSTEISAELHASTSE